VDESTSVLARAKRTCAAVTRVPKKKNRKWLAQKLGWPHQNTVSGEGLSQRLIMILDTRRSAKESRGIVRGVILK